MTTYGEQMHKDMCAVSDKLKKMLIDGYDNEAVNDCLISAAAKVETFLKRDVFPWKNNRDVLYSFIEELKNNAVSDTLVSYFHDLRDKYNLAKHEPSNPVSIVKIISIFEQATKTIVKINDLALGRTSDPIRKSTARLFWICAWDHYTSGQTEVTIFLPTEYNGYLGAPAIDMVLIDASMWDEFKHELPLIGSVHPHEDWIPEGQTKFWLSESDCLKPFVFEGEYKSLLSCLAKYERVEDLIKGLSRADSSMNLLISGALAASDAFAQDVCRSTDGQIEAVIKIANQQYAVPEKENGRLKCLVTKIVILIENLPEAYRGHLSGPVWVSFDQAAALDTYVRDDEIYTMVDKQNRIVLALKD